MRPSESRPRAALRIFLFLALTLGLLLPYTALYPAGRLGQSGRKSIERLWFRGCCALCGLRVRVSGEVRRRAPTLYVANHVSYLDIPVLGMLIDVIFVAKSEVADWPLFGIIARLARTVFIRRDLREASEQNRMLAARLETGSNMIFFPEGTSTNGRAVLPFKSSLFEAVRRASKESGARVQPISITYVRSLSGTALVDGLEDLYTWHGDIAMLPHLLRVFSLPGAIVQVQFHPPASPADFANRKKLAKHCEAEVAAGVAGAHALTGRDPRQSEQPSLPRRS